MVMLALGLLMGQSPLDGYRDKQRVLLVFAPQAGDARAVRQDRLLKGHEAEMTDRDLVAVFVPGDQAALRRQFKVGVAEFAVVLVGKDGGEKLRSREPVPAEILEKTIDAMPMRQDEMKGKR